MNEERDLDEYSKQMKTELENLTNHHQFKQFAYATYDELQAFVNNKATNLIAIKAPPGTTLEIPDPVNIEHIYKNISEVF